MEVVPTAGDKEELAKVPAVLRAFTLLNFLARSGSATLAEIVENLGANKSTVYYTLRTLISLDVVDYNERSKLYRLGYSLVELGAVAAGQFNELAIARRQLAELLTPLDMTIVLYRRASLGEVALVDKLELPARVRITLPPGQRTPIQGGSFGRAFLAYDSRETVDTVLRSGLHAFTSKSVTDPAIFRSELTEVRKRGWAIDREGYALGVSTVAAPIFRRDGSVSLVAAAVAFASVLDDERAAETGMALRAACDRIGEVVDQHDGHSHHESGEPSPRDGELNGSRLKA